MRGNVVFAQKTKILQISLYAILSAFVVELTFGLYSNSLGLITDSMHALLDSIVTLVLLLAAKMSLKPADEEHTYGHGKVESLGGLFGGLAIFLIAIFFIYEAITRLNEPPDLLPGFFAIIGGVYTIGVDIFRITLLGKSLRKIGGTTLKADFYHAFMDLGSTSVAIIGIVLVSYGFTNGDFISALILGGVLLGLSLKLIYRTSQDLTDIISPNLVRKVRQIVEDTDGVVSVGPVLMRRSGDIIFSDITITLRGDESFDRAHEISTKVEQNVKKEIPNSSITIHFEPTWKDVPADSKIYDIATSVNGVKSVHNVTSYKSDEKIHVSLHVMVDKTINLEKAHNISEVIESKIQRKIPTTEHITIHLEPYVRVPENIKIKKEDEFYQEIRSIIGEFSEVKRVGRIISFSFQDSQKIDINCSFDKEESIERIHDITTQIEKRLKSRFKNSIITIHPEPA